MEKIVLMMDTGREASIRTAKWMAQNDCRVILLQKEKRETPDVDSVVINLMDAAAVQAFVDPLERVDVLVLGAPPCPADGSIGTKHDLDAMLDALVYLGRGTGNLLEACEPKLRMGMKRIACITGPEGTHALDTGTNNLLYHQMLCALNMLGKQLFNRLRPDGFTFRWFCEGETPAPMSAGEYILAQLSYHPDEAYIHSDENRLVLRNGYLQEIPW